MTRLDEFDKLEWREVVRKLGPDWTEEQFETAWQGNMELKRRRKLQ